MISKNLVYYGGGRGLNAVISLANLYVINQLIAPEEYGRYAYLTLWSGLIGLLCYGWVWFYSFRHGDHISVPLGLRRAQYWLVISVPPAALIVAIFSQVQTLTRIEATYLLLYPLAVALFTSGQYIHTSQSRLLANIGYALVRSVINLVLILLLVFTIGGASKLFVASTVAYITVCCVVHFKENTHKEKWEFYGPKRNEFSLGFGIAGSALIAHLNFGVDKLIVNNLMGDVSTGHYAQSFEFVSFIIFFVFSIYNVSTYPVFQRKYDANEMMLKNILKRNFNGISLLIIGSIIVMILVKPVFSIVISDNYQAAFMTLYEYNIAISVLSVFITFHIYYAYQLTKKPRYLVYFGLLTLAMNMIFTVFLTQRFGLQGAASGTIATQIGLIIISSIFTRKLFHESS